jgi:hypothetical protein
MIRVLITQQVYNNLDGNNMTTPTTTTMTSTTTTTTTNTYNECDCLAY